MLAHHQDDQSETVLLHMLRGAGLAGLCGMQRKTELFGMRVARPLLGWSRQELREALLSEGQAWREDESNSSGLYLRNRIRHELLPLMEQLSPGCSKRIAQMSQTLGEEKAALDALTGDLLGKPVMQYQSLQKLQEMDEAVLTAVLRGWFEAIVQHPADRQRTALLKEMVFAKPGARQSLMQGWSVYRGWQYLHLISETEQLPLPEIPLSGCGNNRFGGIDIALSSGGLNHGDGILVQEMPAEMLSGCVIRSWQQGDYIRPFGQRGSQSMQDYFVNRKVDAPFRKQVPLICRGQEVLFAIGVGCGSVPRWDGVNQIRVSATGVMPWNINRRK